MNDDALNGATNRPVSLNNEATPDAAIFTSSGTRALFQSYDDDEDFEEEEDFKRDRDD